MSVEFLKKEITINGKTAPNRFAVLPTESNCAAEGGVPSEDTLKRYRKMAEGGAGLIYCEATAIGANARARLNQLVLTPDNWEKFIPLVKAVKDVNPDAVFIIQLDHAGALADPAFSKPAAVYERPGSGIPVLSDRQIEDVIQAFIDSSLAAEKAGFDGVEIKICHGFLGTDFIQPLNNRSGKYGGSFENRTAFITEFAAGVQQAAGSDFIMGLRIPAYESIPGGFGSGGPEEVIEDLSEPVKMCRLAEKAGISIISVSAGSAVGNADLIHPTPKYPDGVYRHFGWASAVKKAVNIPVVGAGYSLLADGGTGIGRWTYWAEKNVADGNVDFVGMGRQGFADPLLPSKVMSGKEDDVNYCTACLGCGGLLLSNKHVKCVVYK